ncbi:MAG: TatD family hydrolase [Muribaculaceae bacterium]|nr:TatD family hydrolase [Muribaculaceae bacterium]
MKTIILDIHHHGPAPLANAVNSIMAGDPLTPGDWLFSVGIHPWQTAGNDPEPLFQYLSITLADTRVVAVGETGIDRLRGASIPVQTAIFNRHVKIATETGKPLIIHSVRSTDILLPILKKASMSIPVIIHGFRGKPTEALQLVNSGAYISLGQWFNPSTAAVIPADRLLAETDESPVSIQTVISNIALARHLDFSLMEEQIKANVIQVLTLG